MRFEIIHVQRSSYSVEHTYLHTKNHQVAQLFWTSLTLKQLILSKKAKPTYTTSILKHVYMYIYIRQGYDEFDEEGLDFVLKH